MPFGVSWLDASSVLLSQPAEIGSPVQLWRMSYPDGAVSRLTNDVNSYHGAGLDGDRHSLVTSRSEMRVAIWVGDGAARSGAEVVPPTPVAMQFLTSPGQENACCMTRPRTVSPRLSASSPESGHRWKSHRTEAAPSRRRTERRLCS